MSEIPFNAKGRRGIFRSFYSISRRSWGVNEGRKDAWCGGVHTPAAPAFVRLRQNGDFQVTMGSIMQPNLKTLKRKRKGDNDFFFVAGISLPKHSSESSLNHNPVQIRQKYDFQAPSIFHALSGCPEHLCPSDLS